MTEVPAEPEDQLLHTPNGGVVEARAAAALL